MRPVLTTEQVEQIRNSTLTDTHFANLFGVNRTTVERARKGRTHSGADAIPRLERPSRGGWKKEDAACPFEPKRFSLPGEEWRPVVGWERVYRVSNLGRVYSLHQTGRLVTGMLVNDGYRVVKVRDHSRRAHLQVHRMVLEAFVGPPQAGQEGCHGENGSTDNSLTNLRWDTKLENMADKVRFGTARSGRRTLTSEQISMLRTDRTTTLKEWAQKFGVSVICVQQARCGMTFKNHPVPPLHKRSQAQRTV